MSPLSFVPPLASTCLAWGPLHPPGWAPTRRRAQHTPFGGGGVPLCPPPAHRGPLTDSSAPQYECWGAVCVCGCVRARVHVCVCVHVVVPEALLHGLGWDAAPMENWTRLAP